jgi:hypothetical protein
MAAGGRWGWNSILVVCLLRYLMSKSQRGRCRVDQEQYQTGSGRQEVQCLHEGQQAVVKGRRTTIVLLLFSAAITFSEYVWIVCIDAMATKLL